MKEICSKCNSVLFVEKDGVGLSTKVDTPLFIEGILNELKHKIQGMRKEAGYEIEDKIILCCDCADKLNLDFIRKDILAEAIYPYIAEGCDVYSDVYGIKIGIKKYPND